MTMSPEELGNLIANRGPALILFARQWCDTPEDVVQQAFLDLVRQRCPPRDVMAWLYRVVRNGAIDAARSRQRRKQREAEVARQTSWFVELNIEGLDAETAIAALQELPMEQREPIVAHLWGGLRFDQIGELVGCSASTAHRRYEAGLIRLREKLGVPCPRT